MSAVFNRQRQNEQQKTVYNPDLEFAQQGIANELYGPGAEIGSVGMSGGQYPNVGMDPEGFGRNSGPYPTYDQYGASATQGQATPLTAGNPGAGQGFTYQRAASRGYDMSGQYDPNTPAGAQSLTGEPQGGYSTQGAGVGVPIVQPAPGEGGNLGGGGVGGGGGGLYQGGNNPGQSLYNPGAPATAWGQGGATGNRNLAGATAYGGYSSMIANPGYSDVEKTRMQTEAANTARAGFAAARGQAEARQRRTGNTAGYGAMQSQLGRDQAIGLADLARSNEIAQTNEAIRQREAGLRGVQGMYGTETGYSANLLGQRARLGSLQRRGYSRGNTTAGQLSASYGYGGGG